MQNEKAKKEEELRISLYLIGDKMGNFLKELSGSNKTSFAEDRKDKKTLEDFWDYYYDENLDFETQLNNIYEMINQLQNDNIKNGGFKKCLIIRIKNIQSPEIQTVLEKQNKIAKKNKDYSPFILFLFDEFDEKNDFVIPSCYKYIEPRGLFLCKYQEHKEEKNNYFENIQYTLYRFCSYHNDLGDIIELGDGKKNVKTYDLVKRHFPFFLNICCIGRFGVGKSTGINFILGELRAKESNLGISQTKNLSYYYHKDTPIRILDIPGFEDEATVEKCIQKLKKSNNEAENYKEKLHILLYFMKFSDNRAFSESEKNILFELNKNKDFQLIYVITHYEYSKGDDSDEEDNEEEEKASFIIKINNGLNQKIENFKNYQEIYERFKATKNNVVFINFYKKKNKPRIGIDDLFKKLKEYFMKTEEYQIFKAKFYDKVEENNEKALEKENNDSRDLYFKNLAKIYRAKAESELRKYRIGGSFLGSIPIINQYFSDEWLSNKAIKVISEIYGIDVIYKETESDQKTKKNEIIKKSLNFRIINAKYENKEDDPLIGCQLDPELVNSCAWNKYAEEYKSFSKYYNRSYTTLVLSDIFGIVSKPINPIFSNIFSAISFSATLGCAGILVSYKAYFTNKQINEIINQFEEAFLKNRKDNIIFCFYLIRLYLDSMCESLKCIKNN